jgi:glycosyltransferase involved in cell wall biosynthesis
MKVLLLIASAEGTIGLISYNLYKALVEDQNVNITVINFNSSKEDKYSFNNCTNFKKTKTKNPILKQLINLKKVIHLAYLKHKLRPNISISTQESCTTINILSGGTDKKIGIFHAPHHQTKKEGKIIYYLSHFSYKYLYRKLDKIYCVSTEVSSNILNNFKTINKRKVEVVYNIHNIEEILIKSKERIDDKELEIFNKDSIIYVGRLDKNKAPDRLIKAFYKLININNLSEKVNLVFIGPNPYEYQAYLEQLVEKFNLRNQVFFLGSKDNPYKYIKKSYCLVSTSISEGLPGVLIESLILNIPVISTNSSMGVWEILSCQDNYKSTLSNYFIASKGIITQNTEKVKSSNDNIIDNDEIILSDALCLLIQNSELYDKMKNEAFSFINNIKADNVITKFLNI